MNEDRFMPRRPAPRTSAHRSTRGVERARGARRLAVAIPVALAAAALAWSLVPEGADRLEARAEAAARAGDWTRALELWRALNRTGRARGRTFLGEAKACLALDRAAQAEAALRRAVAAEPSNPEPWGLWLELLRVEDRTLEAGRVGWEAYASVPPSARRGLLRDLTLALLADLPADLVHRALDRWIAADPADLDAHVARLRRVVAPGRPDDPDRPARIRALADLLARAPAHPGVREALATALADAGEPDEARRVLDAWPALDRDRDALYWRLRGRLDLDFDRQPARAVAAFERVLAEQPNDWKTRARLARALRALGRSEDARQAAETVARTREALDPATLGPRLQADLARLDDSRSLFDLADLAAGARLARLADAWRREAQHGHPASELSNPTFETRPRL
jgi:tetratricopeptide (TPR) repeat protein